MKYIILKVEDIQYKMAHLTQESIDAHKSHNEFYEDRCDSILEEYKDILTNKQIDLSEKAIEEKSLHEANRTYGSGDYMVKSSWIGGYQQALIDILNLIK